MRVHRPITPQNHPFPFLLQVEWGLLAIALLSDLLVGNIPPPPAPHHFLPPLPADPIVPFPKLLAITGFGALGLRLPTRPAVAIPYTLLQFACLALVTLATERRLHLFPVLYVVLVIRSCLVFRWPGRILVTVAALGMFANLTLLRFRPYDFVASPDIRERIRPFFRAVTFNSILSLGLALGFMLFMVNALMAERASQQRLTAANQQLRNYALRVESLAMAQERNRIAREIHDALGHSLTALNLQLETALKLWPNHPEKAQAFVQTAKQLGSTVLQDVRQSVATLRTDPLQRQTLEGAIATLTQNFHTTTSIQPTSTIQISAPLPANLRTSLYRILQEALTNIAKHAHATAVDIQLHQQPEGLRLRIQDNGIGFQPEQNSTGFGIQGIQERTLALGGTIRLQSAPGQGTVLDLTFPLETSPRPSPL